MNKMFSPAPYMESESVQRCRCTFFPEAALLLILLSTQPPFVAVDALQL